MSLCARTRLRTASLSNVFRGLSASLSGPALDAVGAAPVPHPAPPARASKATSLAALGVRPAPLRPATDATARPHGTATLPRAASLSAALLAALRTPAAAAPGPRPAHALAPSVSFTAFTAPARPRPSASFASLAPSAAPPPPTPESPRARRRRAGRAPALRVATSAHAHVLAVRLPHADRCALVPEMVTVVARRGARLRIVADLWVLEQDAHFEWEVAFAHADADLSAVRAVLEPDGRLEVRVRRCAGAQGRDAPAPVVWSPNEPADGDGDVRSGGDV